MVASIAQRELRNNLGAVLRRAEAGERIVVTVDGRPIAELGPLAGSRTTATLQTLRALPPSDDAWLADLQQLRDEDHDHAADPWASLDTSVLISPPPEDEDEPIVISDQRRRGPRRRRTGS